MTARALLTAALRPTAPTVPGVGDPATPGLLDSVPPAIRVVMVVAAVLLVLVLVLRWKLDTSGSPGGGRRGRSRADLERDRSARWAAPRQIPSLLVDAPTPGRLTLGRLGRKTVAAEARRSVLVIAPTGSRKTATYVVPELLRWDGPALVTSVKADVLHLTVTARARRGPVYLFSPGGTVTGPGLPPACRWNPLAAATTYAGARATASWLGDSSKVDARGVEHASYWDTLGEKLLAPLLFAAARVGAGIAQVVRWVEYQDEAGVATLLRQLGDPDAEAAWHATCGREPRTKSSVYGTAEVLLHPFTHPAVVASLAPTGPGPLLDPHTMLQQGATAYLVAPEYEQELFAPVFEALVNAVVRAKQETASRGPTTQGSGLFLCLEEAANVAPIRKLDRIASAGAAQGIVLMSVWQDEGQLERVYGPATARTVIANHTARVYLPGGQDDATLAGLTRLLGDHQVVRTSTSVSPRPGDRTSTSRHLEEVALAPVAWLRERPAGEALVLVGGLPPMRLQVTPYWQDPTLRPLVDPTVLTAYHDAYATVAAGRR